MAEKLCSLKKVGGGDTCASGEVTISSNTDYEIDTGLSEIKFFHMSAFTVSSEWYVAVTTELDQTFGASYPSDTKQIVIQNYAPTGGQVIPAPIPCNSSPASTYGDNQYAPWIKSINGGKVTIHTVWGRTFKWKAM